MERRILAVLHGDWLQDPVLSHREGRTEREREREREGGRSGLVLSDTNFSSRDICSTCSSHLSLSRCYIPIPHRRQGRREDPQKRMSLGEQSPKREAAIARSGVSDSNLCVEWRAHLFRRVPIFVLPRRKTPLPDGVVVVRKVKRGGNKKRPSRSTYGVT